LGLCCLFAETVEALAPGYGNGLDVGDIEYGRTPYGKDNYPFERGRGESGGAEERSRGLVLLVLLLSLLMPITRVLWSCGEAGLIMEWLGRSCLACKRDRLKEKR
jgi:hypothetical protein